MQVKQGVNIHNRFDIEVRDVSTGKLKQKVSAYNIILNQMYNRLCGGSSYFNYIHFGTGTGVVSPTRTSLFTHLGTKSAVTDETIKAMPVSKWKCRIVLNPEEYVDKIITEVGIAFGDSSSNLVTHALLSDAEGNPISINKTSTDVVIIYATVFITLNTTPGLNLLSLPNSNNLINYLTGGPTLFGYIGLLPGEGNGVVLGSGITAIWIADVGNKQRKTGVVRFGINDANGHVKGLECSSIFSLELQAAGVFSGQPYTNVPIDIGDATTKQFGIPSKNIKSESLTVKINGVVSSGYSVSHKHSLNYQHRRLANPPSTGSGSGCGLSADGKNIVALYNAGARKVFVNIDNSFMELPSIPGVANYPAGAAISPNGKVVAFGRNIGTQPYMDTYDIVDSKLVRRPDPDIKPTSSPSRIRLSSDGDVMVISQNTTHFVYDWDGLAWTRRPIIPALVGTLVPAISGDGTVIVIASTSAPYITIYFWTGDTWVTRTPPPITISCRDIKMTRDGITLALAHAVAPYISVYDWVGTEWIARPTPNVPPSDSVANVVINADCTVLAASIGSSPFIFLYTWVNGIWELAPPNTSIVNTNLTLMEMDDSGDLLLVTHSGDPYIKLIDCSRRSTDITFDVAPAVGEVITADYTVDGIHKTNQYVIDASFAIQFGEGV